jgi:hypothetical protein
MNLPTIDSLPLCPVFYADNETNQQRSGERKGTRSLAVTLLASLQLASLRCSNLPGVYKLAEFMPRRGAQTVGVFAYLKILIRQVLRCSAA